MKISIAVLLLTVALPAWASSPRAAQVKKKAGPRTAQLGRPGARAAAKPTAASRTAATFANEAAKPTAEDPDRERIVKLQEALEEVVRGRVLGRLRVGMQVQDLATGRTLFGWHSSALMDPASNQKVLATTAALLRLGSSFRYRTEVTGPAPDSDGKIGGDLVIRGSGDPSLRLRHLEVLAENLAGRGVTRVAGSVLADPRRIGEDDVVDGGRAALRVGSASIEVLVRPGDRAGARPLVSLHPASDAFVVINQAQTRAKGRGKIGIALQRVGNHIQVVVSGAIAQRRGPLVIRRAAPSQALFAAILLRQALIQAGITVSGNAGVYGGESRPRVARRPTLDGVSLALADSPAGTLAPLLPPDDAHVHELLALHESEPLPVLLRRVNKDSDNEWAERVLETAGAEVYGDPPTTAKGVRVLREALADLGLSPSAYLPSNGSGLGHQNRVTAAGMIALLRRLYFDPRVGPELMQSLSVGGVDGTTRNRFRGSSAAHRVRAKTGTLNGVSCLSGFVGDGSDILAFSILVEGHRHRALASVRAAQVSAVNAMMRFSRPTGPLPADEATPGSDFETGDEAADGSEGEGDSSDPGDPAHVVGAGAPATTNPR